jgi:hypothetical protein
VLGLVHGVVDGFPCLLGCIALSIIQHDLRVESIFGGISKFHVSTDFGSFGQIWAEFAALAVANCMPKLWLKSFKLHNF